MEAVAGGCPCLRKLCLSGCLRIQGPGLVALAHCTAVQVRALAWCQPVLDLYCVALASSISLALLAHALLQLGCMLGTLHLADLVWVGPQVRHSHIVPGPNLRPLP